MQVSTCGYCVCSVVQRGWESGSLTNVIVIGVLIKVLVKDIFFNFKFLLLFSRDLPVCPAQDHLKFVRRPEGEMALEHGFGCAPQRLVPRPWRAFRRSCPYLSRKQWAADRTQQELMSTPPHRNLSSCDLRSHIRIAACQGCEAMSA